MNHTQYAQSPGIASGIAGRLMASPLLAIAAAFSCLVPAARSSTIFEFGPSTSYVTENVDFERIASVTGSGPYTSKVDFDGNTPLSPSSGYSGPAFYGGYSFSSDTHQVGFNNQVLFNNYAKAGGNDAIYFNVIGPDNASFHETTMHFASVFVFKQASFNAAFQEGSVGVDGFSISLYKHANGATNTQFKPEGRWLVEIGGTYYLSDHTFANGIANDTYATFALSGGDLQGTLWAAYNPAADLFFDAASADFQRLDLNSITSVGFYIDDASFKATSATVGMRLGVTSFSVTTAIPEPGTVALIGVPLLLGYFLRR